MKRILICAGVLVLTAACGHEGDFDATGTFEATEVVVSAEAAGRILRFDAEEGDLLTAGSQVGAIDSVQLYLRKLQLERSAASVRSNRPDIAKQVASLREQIAKQQTERRRVENLLKDGAATTKQLDDIDAQLKVLGSQLDATLSTLRNNAAPIDENSSSIEVQIAQVEDQLGKCRIVSPISGTVLAKYGEAGELASVGRPLMKVADLDRIYLRAYFTSDQLSELEQSPYPYVVKIQGKVKELIAQHRSGVFDTWLEQDKISCLPNYALPAVISPTAFTSMVPKSLYTAEEDMNEYEFKVVWALSELGNVKWWHRNISRLGFQINGPVHAYPDIIVMLHSGKILMVETKGDHLDNDESKEKAKIGDQWAKLAGKQYKYYMVFETKQPDYPGAYSLERFMEIVKEL